MIKLLKIGELDDNAIAVGIDTNGRMLRTRVYTDKNSSRHHKNAKTAKPVIFNKTKNFSIHLKKLI